MRKENNKLASNLIIFLLALVCVVALISVCLMEAKSDAAGNGDESTSQAIPIMTVDDAVESFVTADDEMNSEPKSDSGLQNEIHTETAGQTADALPIVDETSPVNADESSHNAGVENTIMTQTVESSPAPEIITEPVSENTDAATGSQTPTPGNTVAYYTEQDVYETAQCVYGEALVTGSDTEMAAVAWCILNRVDDPLFPNTIHEVVTARNQFQGYKASNPVDEHLLWLVRDVFERWVSEKNGVTDSGRVLPADYRYFYGDGRHNHFTITFNGTDEWDWSLPSPYKN